MSAARHRIFSVIRNVEGRCLCHGVKPELCHSQALSSSKKPLTDYAFEMAASSIRFGRGVTAEVGMDFKNMNAKKVAVFTDPNISQLSPYRAVIESLNKAKVPHVVYPRVAVEPTDSSMKEAIEFAKIHSPDAFVAVGGGSTIDTAKAANLYLCHPKNEFLDFVNAPIGKGLPVTGKLMPLIAVPTTAGTGSETTGVAIFDYVPKQFKTGIASRALKPTLGLIDPENMRTMPPEVKVASGLDVLCHAMESYTAIPYSERAPRPTDPLLRPAYQGSNPISDVWSLTALRMCVAHLRAAYRDPADREAQEQMALAATFAGIGFGNAGVHLCHGMSYPISGLNRTYAHAGYAGVAGVARKIVPHGISVAVSAPAVFEWTAAAAPERHLDIAAIFGVNVARASRNDAGRILSDALRAFLADLDVPNGISAFGFDASHVADLVVGTLPQHRVTKLAPSEATEEILAQLFERSMKIY